MGRKQKYSKETKLLAVQQYQNGIKSKLEIAQILGCEITSIRQWIRNYDAIGETAFDDLTALSIL